MDPTFTRHPSTARLKLLIIDGRIALWLAPPEITIVSTSASHNEVRLQSRRDGQRGHSVAIVPR